MADLHDALSSDWPHAGALTPGDSLLYLQQLSPDQLWAEAVDALAEIVGPFHDEARIARD